MPSSRALEVPAARLPRSCSSAPTSVRPLPPTVRGSPLSLLINGNSRAARLDGHAPFRTQQQLDASAKDVKALAADGVPYEVLNRDGCVRVEPALAHVREKFVGGLLTPKDETGDCFKFTNALTEKAKEIGVRFLFNTTVNRLDAEANRGRGVVTSDARIAADAVTEAFASKEFHHRQNAGAGFAIPFCTQRR
ncbi:FAD-dependent oxidoreductase (plasmid) [Rhizobium jaguaris]|uniref:FAD-dependent oxidoreductase n=1 Tax=Rhizobium jaguaris TaxID=1312183 RepID=A0A387G047_9HYPH|nr:FAD-dependent oxidoreductase [Rhizobium jaguaris]